MITLSRAFSFLLVFSVLFISASCASGPTKEFLESPTSVGLLWEVKKGEASSCYVFGTIHSEDKRVTRLPNLVNKAFDEADVLALEMKLDKETSQQVLKNLYFTDGRNLRPIIGDELFARSVEAMEKKGLPKNIVNKMKPWAVFTILNMPDQQTGLFLDAILYKVAQEQGKSVYGLETAQEQTAVFDDMPITSQISLLKSTLDNMLDMNTLQDEVIEVYLSRDLDKILALNDKYEALIDEKLAKEFTQRLVIDRNHRMVKRMLPMLQKGKCFVAVGALHLPGDEGILTLLKQRGYEVHATY